MRRMYSKNQIKKIIDEAYEFLSKITWNESEDALYIEASDVVVSGLRIDTNKLVALEDDGLWLSDDLNICSVVDEDEVERCNISAPLTPESMPTIREKETSFEWNGIGEIDLSDLEPYTEYSFESDEFTISGGENIFFRLPSFVKFVFVTGETTSQQYDNYFEMESVQQGTEFGPEGATLTILITNCIAYVLYSY